MKNKLSKEMSQSDVSLTGDNSVMDHNRQYFIEISENENAACRIDLYVQSQSNNIYANIFTWGYFPINSPTIKQSHLILPNPALNRVICIVTTFRENTKNGINDPSRGLWHIKFKIVSIDGFGVKNDATPLYDLHAKGYADYCGLYFYMNPIISTEDELTKLHENNKKVYDCWVNQPSHNTDNPDIDTHCDPLEYH